MVEREKSAEIRSPLREETYSPSRFTRALMAGLIAFTVFDVVLASSLPVIGFSAETANRIAIVASLIPAAVSYYFVNRKKNNLRS